MHLPHHSVAGQNLREIWLSKLTSGLACGQVSAVSSKTNTTDSTRLGAFTDGPSQVALYDTPGVVSTRFFRGNQHAKRVRSAWGTASDCEMLLFIVDAHRQVVPPRHCHAGKCLYAPEKNSQVMLCS